MSDNKRIAKNTIFLYIRMLLILGVTLYASRVVLDKLGVEDYGLYNVVGGVVAILSFISGTLSFGTSRFITFELGTGNTEKLKTTFSTSFYANVLIGIILLVALETVGLWFVNNKLVIPPDRFDAALIVYQISLLTMLFNIIQIPYRSAIIAHEEMGVYAYTSIFEAAGKLIACYLIAVGPFDQLVNYALFLALFQIATTLLYMYYCVRHFEETRPSKRFDKTIVKNILGFSGWNMAANMGQTFNIQGIVIIMNMFFMPAVVGAQAIASQIGNGIWQFVGSFRTAIDPQIIKLYAAGDYEGSKKLTLRSAVYTFDLILLLALPCFFLMKFILNLWLVEVPDYCLVFAQWVILQRIPAAIDGTFFTPMVASGRIKRNALFAIASSLGMLGILYVIFKLGGDVMWVQYICLIQSVCFSFIVKPYILYKDVNYGIREMLLCFVECFKVMIPAFAFSYLVYRFVGEDTFLQAGASLILIMAVVCICSFIFMNKTDRQLLITFVQNKLKQR